MKAKDEGMGLKGGGTRAYHMTIHVTLILPAGRDRGNKTLLITNIYFTTFTKVQP